MIIKLRPQSAMLQILSQRGSHSSRRYKYEMITGQYETGCSKKLWKHRGQVSNQTLGKASWRGLPVVSHKKHLESAQSMKRWRTKVFSVSRSLCVLPKPVLTLMVVTGLNTFTLCRIEIGNLGKGREVNYGS